MLTVLSPDNSSFRVIPQNHALNHHFGRKMVIYGAFENGFRTLKKDYLAGRTERGLKTKPCTHTTGCGPNPRGLPPLLPAPRTPDPSSAANIFFFAVCPILASNFYKIFDGANFFWKEAFSGITNPPKLYPRFLTC